MKSFQPHIILAKVAVGLVSILIVTSLRAATQKEEDDTGIQYPAFVLPESSLLGADTRAAFAKIREEQRMEVPEENKGPAIEEADRSQLPEVRRRIFEAFYRSPIYKKIAARYPVTMTPQVLGGIYTQVFIPADGIAEKNRQRVLINLHGGGFMGGCRTDTYLESAPIASAGKIKIVSIDYRLAPEYEFPAASEDVVVVYRELLKSYKSENIGIYGSSAGGLLTAQAVARIQKEGLPRPGAVGMFCEGAAYWTEGDSGKMSQSLSKGYWWSGSSQDNPYFRHTDPDDPLAFPLRSESVLAKFPPSLLITATRDVGLSTDARTHSVLVKLGVEAHLHVWEGLGHVFYYNPDLPESREMYDVVVRFFDRHLGE